MLFNIDVYIIYIIIAFPVVRFLCFKQKTIIFYRIISLFLSKYYIFAAFLEKFNNNNNNNKYYGQY